jgi:outer membrane receptor protein involved in Fe transport
MKQMAGASGDANVYVDGFQEGGRLPPKQAIMIIRINSSPFAAEYSESGFARIEIITKPGTNTFHGNLRLNFNDESLNARNSFPPAPLQIRNYSGMLSVSRNRWDFFLDFERREQDENAVVNASVLDATLEPKTLKKHTFKFGVRGDATHVETTDRSNFSDTFTFGSDFERDASGVRGADGDLITITPLEHYRRTLLGLPGYATSQFTINSGDPFAGLSQWTTAFFAQDDWRLSQKLTLSYGVRQEFQTHLRDKLNLAPRIGIAWAPTKKGRSGPYWAFFTIGSTPALRSTQSVMMARIGGLT